MKLQGCIDLIEHCTRTTTLHFLIIELLPIVFILEIWSSVNCKLMRLLVKLASDGNF